MNARRTLAVTRKVLRTLKHDPRSLALMLVAPLLAMAVFGFAFGSDVTDVPTAVVNEDEGDLADRILGNVDADAVDQRVIDDWDAARALVDAGTVKAAVYFPPEFTEDATPREGRPPSGPLPGTGDESASPSPPPGSAILLYADGSDTRGLEVVTRALAGAVEETLAEGGARAPVTVDASFAYAEDAQYLDFFVPGIMAFAVLLFTTLLTLLSFVGERTSGTLSRLLATPVRESEIVLGYALAFTVIGLLQGAILLAAAVLVFDVLVAGSLALAFLVIGLLAVDALSLGILLSAAAKREAQAVQFLPLIVFPAFLLSGIFVPTDALPPWLEPFAYAIPPTYAVDALRAIMLRGWGVTHITTDLAALAAFAVLFLALAVVGLRRQRAHA